MNEITYQPLRKLLYYTRGLSQQFLVPNAYYRARLAEKLKAVKEYDPAEIKRRLDCYIKCSGPFQVTAEARQLAELPFHKKTVYYYDYREAVRYFSADARFDIAFGDVNWVPERPTIVKSRPITDENQNAVMLKMEKIRHFRPINDPIRFEDKNDLLVWRGAGWQAHRKQFLKECWDHPLCDVGMVNDPQPEDQAEWLKSKMTIQDQLKYKFILSIEGNDVATNLKWIFQSNSLCFMTKPKMETWFMESTLEPFVHYVEVKDDYSDLGDKIEHYVQHPDEANEIVRASQDYYRKFTDPRLEELLSLLTVQKYLKLSGQG